MPARSTPIVEAQAARVAVADQRQVGDVSAVTDAERRLGRARRRHEHERVDEHLRGRRSGRSASGSSAKVTSSSPLDDQRRAGSPGSCDSRRLDLDPGPLAVEAAQHVGQHPGADALHRADPQPAPARRRRRPGRRPRRTRSWPSTARAWSSSASPTSVSARGRGPPGRSNTGAPTSRSSAGDLLAHRRLRVAELLGRPADGAVLGDGDEGDEVAQLEAGPGVDRHARALYQQLLMDMSRDIRWRYCSAGG